LKSGFSKNKEGEQKGGQQGGQQDAMLTSDEIHTLIWIKNPASFTEKPISDPSNKAPLQKKNYF
jgi:hypothetical protein